MDALVAVLKFKFFIFFFLPTKKVIHFSEVLDYSCWQCSGFAWFVCSKQNHLYGEILGVRGPK